jgi:hypothetical protein
MAIMYLRREASMAATSAQAGEDRCPAAGTSNVNGTRTRKLARRGAEMPDIIHRVGINAPVGKVYDILTSVEGARAARFPMMCRSTSAGEEA